jgi:tyrosine-protein kinase Etk/Wzc
MSPDTPGPPPPDDLIDLRSLWQLLRRNWPVALGCALLGLALAVLYARLAPPVYRATTTLQFAERGTSVPVLDALRDIDGGSEVGTEMEVLRSRTLAEAVIDSLGLQVELRAPRAVPRATIIAAVDAERDAPEGRHEVDPAGSDTARMPGASVVLAPGARDHGRVELRVLPMGATVERFAENLRVTRPNRDANVVRVRVDAPDPELARDAANVLVARYLERRGVVRKAGDRSTVEFLRNQSDTLATQLRAAEEALRRFRERNRVVSLGAEATAQVERLADLETRRTTLDTERRALEDLLGDAQTAPGGTDASPYRRLLAFPTLLRNPTTSSLLEALTALENERATLLVRRTPDDPDVRAVSDRIATLESQAESVVRTYLGGIAGEVAAIDRELATYGRKLEQVPAREVEFARLERDARLLGDIYSMLQTRLKEAQVAEAVEDVSVRQLDVALAPSRPHAPRLPFVLLVGLTGGLFLAAAAIATRNALDRAIRLPAEAMTVGGVPVLARLPLLRRAALAAPGTRRLASGAPVTALPQEPDLVAYDEAVRALRTSLLFAAGNAPVRVAVTSPLPGEGKSLTAARLALASSWARRWCWWMPTCGARGCTRCSDSGSRPACPRWSRAWRPSRRR